MVKTFDLESKRVSYWFVTIRDFYIDMTTAFLLGYMHAIHPRLGKRLVNIWHRGGVN